MFAFAEYSHVHSVVLKMLVCEIFTNHDVHAENYALQPQKKVHAMGN